ncbi:MAG: DNA-directed RNA polymerase subunit A'' [Candidatus Diapherotrites archaeon]|nr:DNA-directed RNA polymerase subunit A'' [Candidatus Diapherotrites archaeon]
MTLSEMAQKDFDSIMNSNKIDANTKKKLQKKAEEVYEIEKVLPGEAVGTVAAQSIGEPTSQGALRAFHTAGALTVTGGLARAKEILTMSRSIATPRMFIYPNKDLQGHPKKIDDFITKLIEKNLKDIAKVRKNMKARKIIIELDNTEMKRIGLTKKQIIEIIEEAMKVKISETDKGLEIKFKDTPLKKISLLTEKIEEITVSGVKNIRKAVIDDAYFEETGETRIATLGTNLKAVMQLEEVDSERIVTNDIREVESVLGIEAARNALLEELKEVYSGGMYVDRRHLTLIADTLTHSGNLQAVGRTGVSGSKESVLARASFEETSKNLFQAVSQGQKETFKGVAENIIAGKVINVGTGTIKVMMKQK